MFSEKLEQASLITGYWYNYMAASGREALLFGKTVKEQCIRSVRRTLTDGKHFAFSSEFPLLGKPFLDFSVSDFNYTGNFLEGDGFGYAPLLSYNKDVGVELFGFEFDLSKGGENNPHAVILRRVVFSKNNNKTTYAGECNDNKKCVDYIRKCLAYMGQSERSERVISYIKNAPWEFNFFGGFLNAKDKPIRITFILKEKEISLIRKDMKSFLLELSNFGYEGGELSELPFFVENARIVSLDFDVMPDGSLSSSLGCERAMEGYKNIFTPEGFSKSVNADFFSSLEKKGFIDSRWREVVKTIFASNLTLPNGEKFTVKHDIGIVKFCWKNGKYNIPKIYTMFDCKNFN